MARSAPPVRLGLTAGWPAPIVERVFDEPRRAEPVRFIAEPPIVEVDMVGLLAKPGATFFSSSALAAAVVLEPIVVLVAVAVAPTPGLADTRPGTPLADVFPAVTVP